MAYYEKYYTIQDFLEKLQGEIKIVTVSGDNPANECVYDRVHNPVYFVKLKNGKEYTVVCIENIFKHNILRLKLEDKRGNPISMNLDKDKRFREAIIYTKELIQRAWDNELRRSSHTRSRSRDRSRSIDKGGFNKTKKYRKTKTRSKR